MTETRAPGLGCDEPGPERLGGPIYNKIHTHTHCGFRLGEFRALPAVMAEAGNGERLMQFLGSGIYRLESSKAVFIDPVRVLNRSYSRFKISPSAYYSRFFESYETRTGVSSSPRKRKRKEKRPPLALALNERELAADRRHQASPSIRLHRNRRGGETMSAFAFP